MIDAAIAVNVSLQIKNILTLQCPFVKFIEKVWNLSVFIPQHAHSVCEFTGNRVLYWYICSSIGLSHHFFLYLTS